ncbi:MAG: tripartite tricarboxylate transporter TctB family protein [Clostridium sp.]|nr:tripartite tricarboxylate transporter TctB family protein [Clostridium sp.]
MAHFLKQKAVAVVCIIIALVWLGIGLLQYHVWDKGPTKGFFPVIIAAVLLLVSVVLAVRKESQMPVFHRDCFVLIAAMSAIYLGTYIIGALPSLLIYMILWIRFYEKYSWGTTLKVTVVMGIIVYGVFVVWLGIVFPRGMILPKLGL